MSGVLQGRDEENSELYANYRPARLVGGHPHPDPIVETASLAGVSPPEPSYEHHLQVHLDSHCKYSVCDMLQMLFALLTHTRTN